MRYMTSPQRHGGDDGHFAARHALNANSCECNLACWSGDAHNWNRIDRNGIVDRLIKDMDSRIREGTIR
jgi:hypothetical protein